MLPNSVIIILREVLEGAILMSVLMALSTMRDISLRWCLLGLAVGLAGALLYASGFETIAAWYDYAGQELTNAAIRITTVFVLAGFVLFYSLNNKRYNPLITALMIIAVSLTIVLEGSEIMLYLSGYTGTVEAFSKIVPGAIIGTGLGISAGAVLYYSLTFLLPFHPTSIAYTLLAFFAASMLSQSVVMLTQVDWIASQKALWNSSFLLDENSLLGQLMYAVIGYEATPTPIQLLAYGSGLVVMIVTPWLTTKISRTNYE